MIVTEDLVERVTRRLCEKQGLIPSGMSLTARGTVLNYANWPDRLAEVRRTLLIVETLYEVVSADASTPE